VTNIIVKEENFAVKLWSHKYATTWR